MERIKKELEAQEEVVRAHVERQMEWKVCENFKPFENYWNRREKTR